MPKEVILIIDMLASFFQSGYGICKIFVDNIIILMVTL